MATIKKKICMLGDFGVGKTSLIRRFVERSFTDEYLSTVGVKISRKSLQVANIPEGIDLLIWDIEGQTKFKAVAPSYLQGAAAVIIVGDVTRPETIQNFQNHIKLFYEVSPAGQVILALNKTDLIEAAVGQKLENFLKEAIADVLDVYQTSAKTAQNVDSIFARLAAQFAISS